MAGSLKDRLSLIRGSLPEKHAAAPSVGPKKGPMPVIGLGPEWSPVAGHCYMREVVRPDPLPAEVRNAPFLYAPIKGEDFIFFDTETTGLSGGAGTVVFLAGIGTKKDGGFRVVQYFLADFPGEKDFLSCVMRELTRGKVLASYNGRAFDVQLLKNRAILNRLSFEPGPQEDLLYLSRRLWKKSIGPCSLRNVEERVLGVHRIGDIPGAQIPELYSSFLRSGNAGNLKEVFEHNLLDVLSLAFLLSHMERVSLNPEEDPLVDCTALGVWHLGKDMEKAERVFEGAFKKGNIGAGLRLGRLLKGLRRGEDAKKVWLSLWRTFKEPEGALELAKYYEHRLRKPERALSLVMELLNSREGSSHGRREDIPALIKRKQRLEGKCNKRAV